jgi:hypothetical protein
VETAGAAGDSLHDESRVFINEDGHDGEKSEIRMSKSETISKFQCFLNFAAS